MKKILITIFLVTFLAICFAFYWFEYRPTKIRKDCFNTSENFPKDSQESFYKNCVMGYGIKL
jgi:hypothetical protein